MMGHRESLKSGDEYDALPRVRRHYHWRAGALRAIKRALAKRMRRNGDRALKNTVEDR